MHNDFKKILRSGIFFIFGKKTIFTQCKFPSVEFLIFFFWCFPPIIILYWNNKKRWTPGLFSCKSLREFSNPPARLSAFKNPGSIRSAVAHDLFWLPLTVACARAGSYCLESYHVLRVGVFSCLSLRRSSSSRQRRPPGLILRDFLTTCG